MKRSLRHLLAVTTAASFLSGCASMPMPRTYVLGDPPPPTVGARAESGLPIIHLRTVSIPDYLDSTDILWRTGPNEVTPSPTGRWGERLSIGLTQALASSLSRRLPGQVVTTQPASGPVQNIFVDIVEIDISEAGKCLVTARWQITEADGKTVSARETDTFSEALASIDDPGLASALTRAIDHLANQIGSGITLK